MTKDILLFYIAKQPEIESEPKEESILDTTNKEDENGQKKKRKRKRKKKTKNAKTNQQNESANGKLAGEGI